MVLAVDAVPGVAQVRQQFHRHRAPGPPLVQDHAPTLTVPPPRARPPGATGCSIARGHAPKTPDRAGSLVNMEKSGPQFRVIYNRWRFTGLKPSAPTRDSGGKPPPMTLHRAAGVRSTAPAARSR
ncbi:hypothetical protein Sru01_45770 [Sphaerisporangium rufum]|uniref:Uncharacterized protein n=1 Tax=Sphaerisporangium rufum TaxID=1381558 RepID=A0A919R942_9ACTN|nr:hypothetical protein Sru01_45770 [Sphaerisporangium rufum]